ncbi:MAG: UbiA family prenyltransferase [Hyphomonadaceae bacterium]|jgi:4-hydroxybenzoate polyprenyltransferase|nr:UbiA family prenyltransferase [Hyphomonadaceae bacterium]
MAIAAPKPPLVRTLLTLGRVSNLPTVWTNVLAGTVLAGGGWQDWRMPIVLAAMSLFYVGGMYLNDYFDRAIDAVERPSRPIPSAQISASAVAGIGLALLAVGIVLMASIGLAAALVGSALAAVIVAYDLFHKGNPVAPIVMGLCRALVYGGAAAAVVGHVPGAVVVAALALLAYVAGITYAARQEAVDSEGGLWPLLILAAPMVLALPALRQGPTAIAMYLALIGASAYAVYLLWTRPFPGAVPHAVGCLIAGISLVDAALLAGTGAIAPAAAAGAGFALTLLLQRVIAGT